MEKLVVFYIDEQQFALHLQNVEEVIHIVDIHPLPTAPGHIAGTVNYRGNFLPVVNIRKLFQLRERDIQLSDQLIITNTKKMKLAMLVDSVGGVVTTNEEEIGKPDRVYLDTGIIEGLFKLHDGIVLINDPERFLTPEQIEKLTEALQRQRKESQIEKNN